MRQQFRLIRFVWPLDSSAQSEKERKETGSTHKKNDSNRIRFPLILSVLSFFPLSTFCCCSWNENRKCTVSIGQSKNWERERYREENNKGKNAVFSGMEWNVAKLNCMQSWFMVIRRRKCNLAFNCISTTFVFDGCFRGIRTSDRNTTKMCVFHIDANYMTEKATTSRRLESSWTKI